jgi:negative regulator of sigma E activity
MDGGQSTMTTKATVQETGTKKTAQFQQKLQQMVAKIRQRGEAATVSAIAITSVSGAGTNKHCKNKKQQEKGEEEQ